MSGKYVPPARRKQSEAVSKLQADQPKWSKADPDDHLVSVEEINSYFWPVSEEDVPHARHEDVSKTLHDSADTPGQLAYILLFDGANPRWETDKIIFIKSSLNLLPVDMNKREAADGNDGNDGTPLPASEKSFDEDEKITPESTAADALDKSPSHPIAVFKQAGHGHKSARSYAFEGWYQVEKAQFLQPGSPELVRMLEQKWSRTNAHGKVRQEKRDEASWKASLSHRWAVVKLREDEAAREKCSAPKVERLPDREPASSQTNKKSVNELLAEMRLGGAKNEEPAASTVA